MPRLEGDPQAAASLGKTVERFISTASDPPYADAPHVKEALRLAFQSVCARHAPPFVNGSELLGRVDGTRLLPIGCSSLDAMLHGGVREGQVLELFGDTASGKTQLCLMAAATTACRGERVVFMDTSNSFAPLRVAEMMRALASRQRPVEELLGHIAVVKAYSAHAVLAALDVLLRQAAAAADGAQQQQGEAWSKPTLIILDSVGAVVAPVLGGGAQHSQGHALLAAVGSGLKALADELGAAVVVTNHLVGGGGDAGRSEKRAALGESWACQAHVRVQLSAAAHPGGPHTATLRTSTVMPPGEAVKYWLTGAGPSGQQQPAHQQQQQQQ